MVVLVYAPACQLVPADTLPALSVECTARYIYRMHVSKSRCYRKTTHLGVKIGGAGTQEGRPSTACTSVLHRNQATWVAPGEGGLYRQSLFCWPARAVGTAQSTVGAPPTANAACVCRRRRRRVAAAAAAAAGILSESCSILSVGTQPWCLESYASVIACSY